jgi:hypothetical protein
LRQWRANVNRIFQSKGTPVHRSQSAAQSQQAQQGTSFLKLGHPTRTSLLFALPGKPAKFAAAGQGIPSPTRGLWENSKHFDGPSAPPLNLGSMSDIVDLTLSDLEEEQGPQRQAKRQRIAGASSDSLGAFVSADEDVVEVEEPQQERQEHPQALEEAEDLRVVGERGEGAGRRLLRNLPWVLGLLGETGS